MIKQKRVLAKTISILLAFIFAFSCGSVAMAAKANYPIIYIYGRSGIYKNPKSDDRELIAYSTDDTMKGVIQEAIPYAARAFLSNEWTAYSDKVYSLLMDAFDGFALNENGEICNNTGTDFTWSESKLSKNYTSNNILTYPYRYDARLSPLVIADDLNNYIEAVKRVTGKNKVSVVARCEGTNVLFGYLYKYQEKQNYKGIASIVLYDSSLYGVDILDAAMGGKIKADPYALGKFMSYYSESGDVSDALASAMRVLQTGYGVTISASVVDNYYSKLRNTLFLRFLKSTYATAPGFWTMVDKYYEDAKNYLFGESGDRQKYAKLIAQIDNYRKNVQQRVPKMIEDMQAKGVYVSAVCKYGFQTYPVLPGAYALSDKLTGLERQSMGATCSLVDSTLSAKQIKDWTENWLTGDLISPDKQVYAFTGLLPYTTWYIKNLEHVDFPTCVNALLLQLCRNQPNVNNSSYDQFMVMIVEDGAKKLIPMTENNCDPTGVMGINTNDNNYGDDTPSQKNTGILQRLLDVVAFFSALIARLFSFLRG